MICQDLPGLIEIRQDVEIWRYFTSFAKIGRDVAGFGDLYKTRCEYGDIGKDLERFDMITQEYP